MNTFQAWLSLTLGSATVSVPYQTASERPGPPALTQGKTFTLAGAWLTCTGVVHLLQPVSGLAALTNTWRSDGVPLEMAKATCRFRAESMERTLKSVSGEPFRLSAMWISLLGSPFGAVAVGWSRKARSPAAF